MDDTLALTSHETARPPGIAPVLRHGATRHGLIATWRERIRFRRDLAQMTKGNPHLIDDIGLTRRHVEVEIAKPFWRG